jgi:HAE1 family hydrophobic/amphiphilic exporter-1
MAKPVEHEQLDGMIISDTSIRQPVFITMLMLLTIVIGLLAYRSLPVNLLPDFQIPIVAVSVNYPGAGPESMADQVAKPLEDTINTINGVKHITSNSSEGITTIIVEFNNGIDADKAEQSLREKVNAVLPRLPRDVRTPTFLKFDPNDQAIVTVAISTKAGTSPLELRHLVDNDIVPQLQRVEGVGSVDATGGQVRQINVSMDLDKLKSLQILPVQISRALQAANTNYGLGSISAGERDVNLRAPSQIRTPADIGRIQITGTPFRISDVATVQDGVADPTSYARLDGRDAITLAIRKQSGTNTVTVADAAKAQIKQIFATRPDLQYFIPNDQSESVRSSTESAIEELLIAVIAAMLVVLVFFRDIRNTLVTVAGLPVIMIGTFALLQAFGLSINLITLLALSLSVGLVIDDAIVVRENIFRRMERGESPKRASSRGTAEVSLSVLAMTLTIISVFLPVAFTGGTTGIIFKSFGITVASAMAISLIEAFTLAPMLSAYLFKQRAAPNAHHAASDENHEADISSVMHEANEDPGVLGRLYAGTLRWALRHRGLMVLITIGVLLVSGFTATRVKQQFFPNQDNHLFTAQFELPPGTPLAMTNQIALKVEQVFMRDPAVEAVVTTAGLAGAPEKATFFIKLKAHEPTVETQDRLRPQLAFAPKLAFAQPNFGSSSADVSGRPIQVSIQSTRPFEEVLPVVQRLGQQASAIPGLADIDTTYKPGKPELRFYVDPTKTGNLGVTNDDIATSVRALINGDRATVYRENGDDVDVMVRLKQGDRSNVNDVQNISVPTKTGSVPLSSLVRVETGAGPTTIRRYDRLNQILIGANVVGRSQADVQRDVQFGIDQFKKTLPPELSNQVFIGMTGNFSQQTEGFTTLFIAMGLSVLFVYMVLASQFGSFIQPLVIMMAMPFSFLGAFVALELTGIPLDITGMIGLIMLLGLVTKNSILLVDFTNQLRRAGMEKNTAIERAGAIRLRPILMTTLALVAGALPTAIGIHIFASGQGTEFRRGLAVVLIGGLLTSMLLTLLVVPIAYSLLESVTRWVSNIGRRRPRAEPALAAPVLTPAAAAAGANGHAAGGSGNGHAEPERADGLGERPVDREAGLD